jgi:RsiW-degrading membrane proteinase PrsW (M82 family)
MMACNYNAARAIGQTAGPAVRWPKRRRIATIAATAFGRGPGALSMSRSNILYLALGALIVVAAVLGYQVYQDKKKPEGVNINLGPGGISIEKK